MKCELYQIFDQNEQTELDDSEIINESQYSCNTINENKNSILTKNNMISTRVDTRKRFRRMDEKT